MDNLEKYIQDAKEQFYKQPLPEGHEFRFLQKLKKTKPKIAWQDVFFRAAIVIFFALASSALLYWGAKHPSDKMEAKLANEIQEAENYYLAKCEAELSRFKAQYSSNSPVDIAEELERLEKEYANLKKKMSSHAGNERVLAALIQNLQLRLQLLEQINRLMEKEEPQIIEI